MMHTSIDSVLNKIAENHYGKNWQDLGEKERGKLEGYAVIQREKGAEYLGVEPQNGYIYGRYVSAEECVAEESVNRYIDQFITDYSHFATKVGATISLPKRDVKAVGCLISKLAKWKQELQQWASDNNGAALAIARDACENLSTKVPTKEIAEEDATPEKLSEYQKSIEKTVFKAVAAGREAFGQSDKVAQYLLHQASEFRNNVEPGDSSCRARDVYVKATDKAVRLVEVMDKLGIVLEMNKYASLLEHLSELERVAPEDANAEFAKFTETVKEIISDFPAGAEGVKKAKQLVLTVLNDKEEVIKTRLNAVCEQCRNAQVQAEQRANRKLPTPVRGIVDTVARSFAADEMTGVLGFDDLTDDEKESLKKKVVALHKLPPDREGAREINEYSIEDEGIGIFSVAGAGTLVASVNKRVNETISEVNALAEIAGIEAGIEPLNETRHYRVSDLLDLDDELAGWAKENPYLMDLIDLKEELSKLAKLKSSDDERAETVHKHIDENLNNIIVACIDGKGNAVALLHYLVQKVPDWKNAAVNEAKPSCDYVTKKALELVGAMERLQELQEGDSAPLPELSGKGVISVISALEPLVACCSDQTTAVDKLDESYFKAARTLSEQEVQFKDIPCILSAYCSGALTTAKSRMRELSYCMDKGDAASDRAGAKAQKAKEFAVAINSCDQLKLLKTVADDTKEFDQKYCQALTTLMNLGLSAEESARKISDHLKVIPGSGGVGDLVKEMADTLPIIPHTGPVTEGYVGVVRDCSHHIKALKKAGDSIERMEDAKRAINGFAAVLIQQPENANLDEALKGVNQWIKEQKDSGRQFQPAGSALSRLTGFAQHYDSELVRATEAVSQLCKDFDVCLEKFHQTDDDSKIGLKEWINDHQLSPQLAEAFTKRARLSEDSAVVAVPPPPPPPPVGMAAGSNMKSEVAGQKPKLAPKPKSGVATLPTSSLGRIIFDFSNVKLKKTTRSPEGAFKGTHDPKDALMAQIRQGKKLKKTDNSRNSPEQSARLESKDQKEKIRQAEKKMLDSQLGRLETQIEDLEGRVKRAGDPGVVRAHELKLRKLRQDVDVFYKENPNFKKGSLTAEQLATPEKSEDVDLLLALTKRVRATQSDEEDSASEDDAEWSD